MYCAPINRERFNKEFKGRYLNNDDQRLTSENDYPTKTNTLNLGGKIGILYPIKVYKCVKNYYMLNNLNMILQIFYSSVLFHIFLKAVINIVIIGKDKQMIEYFNSIYYPKTFGFSSKSHIFDYAVLGYSFFLICVRIMRMRNVINMSLTNANEYIELKVGQVNIAYFASFYLSLSEWIKFWKYVYKHKCCVDSNCGTDVSHLGFNKLVQQTLPKLAERDAIFYVNPIDFDSCYANSILPDDKVRVKRYSSWHFAFPINRISFSGMRLIFLFNILGLSASTGGFILTVFGLIYLETKSELPGNDFPSIEELIKVTPYHWSLLISWIRLFEASVISGAQILNIFDMTCACLDLHITTTRVNKIVQTFEEHVKYSRFQAEIQIRKSNSNLERQNDFLINDSSYDLYAGYNNQVRHDISLIRLVYNEFLNAKRYNTGFLSVSIFGQAVGTAYMIPVLLLQPKSIENYILIATLISSIVPIVLVLFYCARVERMVSPF